MRTRHVASLQSAVLAAAAICLGKGVGLPGKGPGRVRKRAWEAQTVRAGRTVSSRRANSEFARRELEGLSEPILQQPPDYVGAGPVPARCPGRGTFTTMAEPRDTLWRTLPFAGIGLAQGLPLHRRK